MVNTPRRRHKHLKEMSNAMCVSKSEDSTSTEGYAVASKRLMPMSG